ncbi:MAG: sporulation protein [Clostridiales bacterium]|nr:sporulation protein [Clostridiales bacterium]
MRMRWRAAACLALGGVLVLFLAEAGFVRAAAAEALSLCAGSVIPALFPFLVVSSLLLSLGLGELLSPMLAGLMEPLFRVDGVGSSALLLGLVGGYPIGAKTAADLYRGGRLSRPEAERLLAFCNNSNPVFLISVLGVGVFGSVRAGVWLWLIHLLSALLTGLLFRNHGGPARRQAGGTAAFQAVSLSAAFVAAVRESLSGMLSVCAFVTFFYVLARPLASLGGWLGPVLVGLTELFSLTPLLRPDRFGFILASAMAGWGGLSVLCQTAAVLEGSGLRLQSCAAGKAVQGLLAGLLAALLAGYALS